MTDRNELERLLGRATEGLGKRSMTQLTTGTTRLRYAFPVGGGQFGTSAPTASTIGTTRGWASHFMERGNSQRRPLLRNNAHHHLFNG